MMLIYNILYNHIYFLDIYEYKMVIKCIILYLVRRLIAYIISWSYEVIFYDHFKIDHLKFIAI